MVSAIIIDPGLGRDAAGHGHGDAAARSRAAARPARDADRDRQVQGRRRPRQISPLELKAGAEGYPPDLETLVEGVPAANDATGRKLKFLRRIPVDPMTHERRVGAAVVPGRARRHTVGRAERVRRLHDVRRHGARRHEVQGLVRLAMDRRRASGLGERGFTLIELMVVISLIVVLATMGLVQYRQQRRAVEGSGAQGRSLPDARRDRSVLRRQEPVSGDARVAGHRRLPARGARRIPFTNSDSSWQAVPSEPDPATPSPSPASTTSRAAPSRRPRRQPLRRLVGV